MHIVYVIVDVGRGETYHMNGMQMTGKILYDIDKFSINFELTFL